MQIIVLGMHRSGTSLTTRLVNMMGAYAGPEGACGYNADNPKGFWERNDVVKTNASLLKLYHVDWINTTVTRRMLSWELPAAEAVAQHMRRIVFNMDGHRPWVMKDPHLCLTLSHWLPLLEVPVCVIAYRDPLEIAHSLRVRQHNAVESFERAIALWEYYAVSLLNATRHMPRIYVAHADMMSNPPAATAKLYNGLAAAGVQGLRLPSPREINAFIDAKLYRSRAYESSDYPYTEQQRALIALLKGEYTLDGMLSVSEASRQILLDNPLT
jgi:hypothetical protein